MLDGDRCKYMALLAAILVCGTTVFAIDEYSDRVDPLLQTQPAGEEVRQTARVTAVYGINAEDYLPMKEDARRHLRPNLRENSTLAGFDLPDAFYFIGGPIFLLILFRVLVIFLNGFEEDRQEELRMTAGQKMVGERIAGESLPGERFARK